MLREGGSNYDDDPAPVRRALLNACDRYIKAAQPAINGLMPVRVSATIVDEYVGRAVFGGDADYPFVAPKAGVHLLPRETVQAMFDDAKFNADAACGPEEMPGGTRRAYRSLVKQLGALLAPTVGNTEKRA
jgi:hypothetical protein